MQLEMLVVFGSGLMSWISGRREPARRFARAGDEAIGLPVLHHHRGEIIRVHEDLVGAFAAEIAVTFQLLQPLHKGSASPRRLAGSMMPMWSRSTLFRRRHALDLGARAEHDRRAEPQPHKARSGPQTRGSVPFGEDDALGMPLQFLKTVSMNFMGGDSRGEGGSEQGRTAVAS